MTAFVSPAWPTGVDVSHAEFLSLLPRVQGHAEVYFRSVACPQTKADYVAEVVALTLCWYRKLSARGREPGLFIGAVAAYAARAVACGRRLVAGETARDALSGRAQRRHSFHVARLPVSTRRPAEELYGAPCGQRHLDAYEQLLADHGRSTPADTAIFRVDFDSFLRTLSPRDRLLVACLAQGDSAAQVAEAFGLSRGRLSQLRMRWCKSWHARHGERAPFERRAARRGKA
jgi:hypothetical protein